MDIKTLLREIFLPNAPATKKNDQVTEKIARPKKPGKRPHPVKTFFAWMLGIILLVIACILFFRALVPAMILITIGLVVTPAGEDLLYKIFGFDFCHRCKSWILIIGGLLFVASLGAMA